MFLYHLLSGAKEFMNKYVYIVFSSNLLWIDFLSNSSNYERILTIILVVSFCLVFATILSFPCKELYQFERLEINKNW